MLSDLCWVLTSQSSKAIVKTVRIGLGFDCRFVVSITPSVSRRRLVGVGHWVCPYATPPYAFFSRMATIGDGSTDAFVLGVSPQRVVMLAGVGCGAFFGRMAGMEWPIHFVTTYQLF